MNQDILKKVLQKTRVSESFTDHFMEKAQENERIFYFKLMAIIGETTGLSDRKNEFLGKLYHGLKLTDYESFFNQKEDLEAFLLTVATTFKGLKQVELLLVDTLILVNLDHNFTQEQGKIIATLFELFEMTEGQLNGILTATHYILTKKRDRKEYDHYQKHLKGIIFSEINNYVNIDNSFLIGKYQVTQEEYLKIMGNNPSNFTGKANLPVEEVGWFEAINFCNAKSTHDGLELVYTINGEKVTADHSKNGYRLPTEKEWEYAAKGGAVSQGYEYSGSNDVKEVAWCADNSNKQTHPIGLKKSNELGLYDMSGNVWEWCWDWYETGKKEYRVSRGGGWGNSSDNLRSSRRFRHDPDYRNSDLGFRCAKSL